MLRYMLWRIAVMIPTLLIISAIVSSCRYPMSSATGFG